MVIPKLPLDLESEILSRVPPTSVKQLRFTCKRWNALLKDRRFIKKHLAKAATQMVLKKDESVYSFSFDFQGIHTRYDQFITFTGKLASQEEDVKISEIFHCEGLLLFATKDNSILVVWNPCTGQTRWIQSRLPCNGGFTMYCKHFLGYGNKDKSCDSFKILRYSHYYHENEIVGKLELYEFNSDSWRDFHDVNWGILSYLGVSLKGNTYWLGSDDNVLDSTHWMDSDDEDDDTFTLLLRFDFTTERFERRSLPNFQSDDDDDSKVTSRCVLSVVREEKLALLVEKSVHYKPLEMKIWVTTNSTKDLSWSVFLVVDFTRVREGVMMRAMSFLVDEENKRVMCCHQDCGDQGRTVICVAGEDIYKPVYGEFRKTDYDGTWKRPSPLLLSYVPSLVQIPAKQKVTRTVVIS